MLMEVVKRLESSGITNDTVILFGSDHGCRFGYISTYVGRHESRLPLMYGIFPKQFREKYPSAVRNFKFNSENRLTSQFDMYYTLKALANTASITDPRYDPGAHYGMNLFAHVPVDRSCDRAGVEDNFCMCGSRTPLETTDPRVKEVAKIFLRAVNELIRGTDCVQFKEYDIVEAYMMQPHEEITLTIHTKPVVAKLRTTIGLDRKNVLLSHIDRLEKYENVTSCMSRQGMMFRDGGTYGNVCVCKVDAWKVTERKTS